MRIKATDAILGHEERILIQLTGISYKAMNGKNQPCPACSSKAKSDRFRVVKTGSTITGYYCGRGYGNNKKGSVIGLIAHLKGIDYKDACDQVLDALGIKNMSKKERASHDRNTVKIKAAQDKNIARHNAMIEKQKNEVADNARKIWGKSSTKLSSPYLKNKKIKGIMLRELNGVLKIPVTNMLNNIVGLQSIYPNGDKKFMKNQAKTGNFCLIGKHKKGRAIIFVEGYATGETVYSITGLAVVVCFDAGNLRPVIKQFKKKLPKTELILFADNDHGKYLEMVEDAKTNNRIKPCNRGNETIKEMRLIGVKGIQPIHNGDHKKISDWNDVYHEYGKGEFLRQARIQYKAKQRK